MLCCAAAGAAAAPFQPRSGRGREDLSHTPQEIGPPKIPAGASPPHCHPELTPHPPRWASVRVMLEPRLRYPAMGRAGFVFWLALSKNVRQSGNDTTFLFSLVPSLAIFKFF